MKVHHVSITSDDHNRPVIQDKGDSYNLRCLHTRCDLINANISPTPTNYSRADTFRYVVYEFLVSRTPTRHQSSRVWKIYRWRISCTAGARVHSFIILIRRRLLDFSLNTVRYPIRLIGKAAISFNRIRGYWGFGRKWQNSLGIFTISTFFKFWGYVATCRTS